MSAELNWRKVEIRSKRMSIKPFVADDAHDVFRSITLPISRFMAWEPPTSWPAFAPVWQSWLTAIRRGSDVHFVLRSFPELRYLGLVGLHGVRTACPELGIWIREDEHGRGYGGEAIAAVAGWASERLDVEAFEYPVAEENISSRRIAEALGGVVCGTRSDPKYTAVLYRIPSRR
jgi:RimJ/RimL family protein N-acetyltransferase